MPSLNIVTTSIPAAVVVNVGVPPANFTAVEPSVPNVAVLDPVPSCVMIKVTEPPVGRLDMLNSVFVANVTLCVLANEQSTVIVDELVNALMSSL